MRDEKTNREKRRIRRIRNQIMAYVTLALLIILAATAIFFAVKEISVYIRNYNDKVNQVIEEAESSAAAEAENSDSERTSENLTEENETVKNDNEDPLNELIESLLSDMTIEEMVAGMFMVSPESITGVQTAIQAGDGTKTALAENPVGGIIYSEKNYKSEEQFSQMITNTRSFSKYSLFTAVKAECGEKTGFGIEATPKASELTDTDSVRQAYGNISSKLASYGVNMNMAPVSETVSEDGNTSLQGRTFGSDAATAAPLVNAAVLAMQENEVSAVLQKFPGTDVGSKTLEELKNSEFLIYDMAVKNGVDCIMVSHTTANAVTGDDMPSSLSAVMINDVLRNELGFNGVIITDYMNDSAITDKYSSSEAAVAAVSAGADIILEPKNYKEAYEGVIEAVSNGTITEERIYESMYRIYKVKYKNALENR